MVANVNHYQAAAEMIERSRLSEIEVGRAQVHATLALTEMLRAVLAQLTAFHQAAAQGPPTDR
jgi:hypothetical protein